VVGGFVRPLWDPAVEFLDGLAADVDAHGHLAADRSGRTSVAGLYAAGDAAAPGPQQLIVAAGQGARAAAVIIHDLVGVVTAH
jgi:thioredoxin reductase